MVVLLLLLNLLLVLSLRAKMGCRAWMGPRVSERKLHFYSWPAWLQVVQMLEPQNIRALAWQLFQWHSQFHSLVPHHILSSSDWGCSCGIPSTAGMRLMWRATSSTSGSCGTIAAAGLALAAGWSCCCWINTKGSWEVAVCSARSIKNPCWVKKKWFVQCSFFWDHQSCVFPWVLSNLAPYFMHHRKLGPMTGGRWNSWLKTSWTG